MPVRRDGAAAAFLLALSTREGAFLLEKGLTINWGVLSKNWFQKLNYLGKVNRDNIEAL